MRKPCPRCKSTNTRISSPKMMSCRNCKNTWGLHTGASISGKKIIYSKGKSQKESKKNHGA